MPYVATGPFAIQCARLGEGESGGSTARPCLQPDTDDEFAVQSPVRWARRGKRRKVGVHCDQTGVSSERLS